MNSHLIPLLAVCCLVVGCDQQPTPEAHQEKPARVEVHPNETDIYRVLLTPKAEQRLQISTAPVRMEKVLRGRTFGADLVVPDGQRTLVNAPLTGTLKLAARSEAVVAGQAVTTQQALLELTPMLPPEREVPGLAERVQMANSQASLISAQIQADGDVQQAKAQVEAAEIDLARAQKLLADRAGSQRDVDTAQAALNIASRGLEAAQERAQLLAKLTLEAESGEATVIAIRAPSDGIIQTITAQVGQVVSAGTPLFEIVDLGQLWARVPVYAGQIHEIDGQREATLNDLSSSSNASPVQVIPVQAPPTADPLATSIDLYYQVDNSDGRFHPGQRVSIDVPMKGTEESLVVPRDAILRDIHGTAWVYVKQAEHEFRRARVAVRFTTDELSILSLGPEVGEQVVVDGAAELFGTEFGAGK